MAYKWEIKYIGCYVKYRKPYKTIIFPTQISVEYNCLQKYKVKPFNTAAYQSKQ